MRKVKGDLATKACELRWTQGIAAAELAGFHELREKLVKRAVRGLAQRTIAAERARLEAMRRAIRGVVKENQGRSAIKSSSLSPQSLPLPQTNWHSRDEANPDID